MDALTPKIAMIAVMSVTPTISEMSTIITDELIEYSTQRK